MPAGPRGDYGVSYTDRIPNALRDRAGDDVPRIGCWIITIADPFGAGTAGKVSGSVAAAKQHALVVANGYLRNTYQDLSWPAIPDQQVRWKRILR